MTEPEGPLHDGELRRGQIERDVIDPGRHARGAAGLVELGRRRGAYCGRIGVGHRGPGVGGVRTFPLIALAGALSAFIAQTLGVWPILGAMLIVGAFLAVSYYQDWSRSPVPGITTQVAASSPFSWESWLLFQTCLCPPGIGIS